jgi:tetratricopeptide (TPR) repeat protein
MCNYNDAAFHLEKAFEAHLAVFGDDGEQNVELGVTSNLFGNLYRDLGKTEKALAMYERSLRFMHEDNPYLASVLTDMGEFYRQQGDYEKANACLQRAMVHHRKLYGEESETAEIAFTLMNL